MTPAQVVSPALLNTPNTSSVPRMMTPAAPPPFSPAPAGPQIFTPTAPPPTAQVLTTPAHMQMPHEGHHASLDIGAPPEVADQPEGDHQQGFMGWLAGNSFVNKMVEKTKVSLNFDPTL